MVRKKAAAEITAASLALDVPVASAKIDSASGAVDRSDPLAVEEAPSPDAEERHEDIGNWRAEYWRGRPIWRHKRTGTTLFKRAEVWRQRNLK